MDIIVETEGLTKVFRRGFNREETRAVENLTLTIHRGEIFGLLGPNGAGKTTTINLILGLLYPTSGRGMIMGHPLGTPIPSPGIGFLPEVPRFYEYLNGEELLDFYCEICGQTADSRQETVAELLKTMGLEDAGKKRVKKYSKGMRQRMGIAQALIADPEFLILDEPAEGLDPLGRKEVRKLLFNLKEKGKTILICSHILSEIEQVCDRVGIMNKGKMVESGRLEDLLVPSDQIEIVVQGLNQKTMEEIHEILSSRVETDKVIIIVSEEKKMDVINLISQKGGEILSVNPKKSSLEEIFVEKIESQ
jgi:ABC-2 type transport system ATP-binding protein